MHQHQQDLLDDHGRALNHSFGWHRNLLKGVESSIGLLFLAFCQPTLAATIHIGEGCDLAQAIHAANLDRPVGTCPAGFRADTIVLRPNQTITAQTVNSTVYGPTAFPVIGPTAFPVIRQGSDITIRGKGSTIMRAPSAPDFGIFAVDIGGTLRLHNVTLAGGSSVQGGAIANYGALAVFNSTIADNRAVVAGGGIYNYGYLTIANSTLSSNSALLGGGAYLDDGIVVTITDSTISANTAGSDHTAGGYGGGLLVEDRTSLTLSRTLISGNAIKGAGDSAPNGIEVFADGAFVHAGDFNLFGHSGRSGIVGFTQGATDLVPTQEISEILTSTLTIDGGATATHALVSDSPAIDAVINGSCPPPAADQRGVTRPQDGNGDGGVACDVGAYEFVAP